MGEDSNNANTNFDDTEVGVNSRCVSICECFPFESTPARARFGAEIDARRKEDKLLLKQVQRIKKVTNLQKYRTDQATRRHQHREAAGQRNDRRGCGGWRRLWRGTEGDPMPPRSNSTCAPSDSKSFTKQSRNDTAAESRRTQLAIDREHYVDEQGSMSLEEEAEEMGITLSSERGRYSQSLTLLTIEPNTFLPFQISWAVLGYPLRLRRFETIKRESALSSGSFQLQKPSPTKSGWDCSFPMQDGGHSAPRAQGAELMGIDGGAMLQHGHGEKSDPASLSHPSRTAQRPPTDSTSSTATRPGTSTAPHAQGILKAATETGTPKFCRDLFLEFMHLLGETHYLYQSDAELSFLLDMRRAAVLWPLFRRMCIESRRILPLLIARLIRCLNCINERSTLATDRYRRLLMTVPKSSLKSLSRWTNILVKLEKHQVRRQMLSLFDVISAILQDSEGIKARMALVEDSNASFGGDNLMTLIDVCFEYRTTERVSRHVEELRKSQDRERSLFVPQATFDSRLNEIDVEFTVRFVEILFQTFSIYQHANAVGLVQEFNFLNPLMERVRDCLPRR